MVDTVVSLAAALADATSVWALALFGLSVTYQPRADKDAIKRMFSLSLISERDKVPLQGRLSTLTLSRVNKSDHTFITHIPQSLLSPSVINKRAEQKTVNTEIILT